MDKNTVKVVMIHGNGGATAQDHWFPYAKENLEKEGINVVAMTMPDNEVAHESIWVSYLKSELGVDENTVLVVHSSGAVAALRYAENHKIYGSVIVGASYTDLGDAVEKESGYFNRAWNWEIIKTNQHWIMQFASTDDPYIPIEQPRYIHDKLDSEYFEFSDRGHFMIQSFPELARELKKKIR